MYRRHPSMPLSLLAACLLTACSDLTGLDPSLAARSSQTLAARRFDPTRGTKDTPAKPKTDSTAADTSATPPTDTTATAPTAPTAPADTSTSTSATPTAPPAPTTGFAHQPALPAELAVPSDVPATGRTWRRTDIEALRAAVSQATRGDQILLTPGTRYVGNLSLPPKSGTGWITIRTDLAAGEVPPAGVRVTAAGAARFAKIVSYGRNQPAVAAEDGSRGWRFTAVEIAVHDTVRMLNTLVALGLNTARTLEQVPSDFIFDRVYIHGGPDLNLIRCVALNSARTAIVNSTVDECHARGFDSAALGGWSGPGPYRIENNSLSGAGMGIFFGGSDPLIANLSPSDIVIRNNRVWRPLAWKGVWTVKALVEFKHARRVLMEGNVIENNWADAQTGFAVLFKSTNQDGGAPWSGTTDVTFRHNVVRHAAAGLNLAARPEPHEAVPLARVKAEHNLFYDIGAHNGTTNGRMVQVTGAVSDVQLLSNTFIHNDVATQALMVDADQSAPLAVRVAVNNNIWTHGQYGWFGNWVGTRALTWLAGTSYQATGNVLIAAGDNAYKYTDAAFATSVAAMGFANPAAGDFTLSALSPFRTAGAGGTMPGVDMAALSSATSIATAVQ